MKVRFVGLEWQRGVISRNDLSSKSSALVAPYAMRTGFPNVGIFYTAAYASGSSQLLPLAAFMPKRGIVIQILFLLDGR